MDKLSLGSTSHPVTVTTRIIIFFVGDSHKLKPSFGKFATITGWGVDPNYNHQHGFFRLFDLHFNGILKITRSTTVSFTCAALASLYKDRTRPPKAALGSEADSVMGWMFHLRISTFYISDRKTGEVIGRCW